MSIAVWTSSAFLDTVTAWVEEHAGAVGITLTGESEQPHARPWSSAIRFATDSGDLWFKVNGPGTAHEPALTSSLGAIVPGLVPELLASDRDRGWTLMRDAGPVLRSVADPDQLWDRWVTLLQEYAAAQLTLAGHLDELIHTGVEDLRPAALPARARELVDSLAAVPEERGGLAPEDVSRLTDQLPVYERWCAELAASGVPASINHDDLHSSNVCVGPGGSMRVIDWGDASVMHPFGTMLATLNSVAWHVRTEVDDPRVERLRDAYLEVFAEYGDHADRVHWVTLARRTGCVSKALSYVHAFDGAPEEAQAEEDWPVRGWLLEMLEG